MKTYIFKSLKFLFLFTILLGLLYPFAISITANIIFPQKAAGSFIEIKGKTAGSELIGQSFSSDKYFWPRPSAIDYNPMPSGGSNLSPTSSVLKNRFDERKKNFLEKNYLNSKCIVPAEMLFASGSGVDPHISPEAAFLQAGRIIKARNFDGIKTDMLYKLIESSKETPQFGFLGKPVINVLLLNLKLDSIQ